MEEDVSSYWMTLKNNKILETERGITRSHYVEKHFGRGYGPVVRHYGMKEWMNKLHVWVCNPALFSLDMSNS